MIDITGTTHHPAIEEIVDVLCRKTGNTDKGFFRVEVAYFLAKMASCMRAVVVTKDRGEIPVNIYALALATSGYGKGHSVHIVENDVMMAFKKRFMEETMPVVSDQNLWSIANARALRNQSDQQEEFDKAEGILEAYTHSTSVEGGARGAVMFGDEMLDEASRKMALVVSARGRAAGMTVSEKTPANG